MSAPDFDALTHHQLIGIAKQMYEDMLAGEAENKQLREALDAAASVMWMAEKYAEGGGSDGPEMQDFTWANCKVESERAANKQA